MNDFSLINITMNNGVTYRVQSRLRPNTVIKRIKDDIEDDLVIIDSINGYVVLNKNKIVGIDVNTIYC